MEGSHTDRTTRRILNFAYALYVVTILVVLAYGYLVMPGWVGVAGKSFWDYLVFLVPLGISVQLALFASMQSSDRARIEEERAHRQHTIEEEKAQESAVQTYLDQLASLVAQSGSHTLQESAEVRPLVTARTRMLLNQVDGYRKKNVLQFLYEGRLIQGNPPTVSLRGADLREVNLGYVDLSSANLSGANLQRADLTGANLTGARLMDADLKDANLKDANLERTIMPDGQNYDDWLKSKDRGEDGEHSDPS